MARNYPADTQMQKALEERYLKENNSQFSWYFKQKQEDSNIPLGESAQIKVFRRKAELAPAMSEEMRVMLPSLTGAKMNKKRNIQKFDEDLFQQLKESGNLSAVEMRPPSPKSFGMLYDGFSKEGKGRYQYLRSRRLQNPETKFSYPILSSMEYGWRLADVVKKEDLKKPAHGRTRLIDDTFYTRTGIPIVHGGGLLSRSKTFF